MTYDSETNRAYLKARYNNQRQGFIEFLGGKCAVCNTNEELEIDHVDWREKSFNVSGLWPQKKLPLVYKELEKCQLLCNEHHKEKTAMDLSEIACQRGITHGGWYAFLNKKCQCDICLDAKRAWYNDRNARRRKGDGRGAYGRASDHGEYLHYRRGCRCDLCRAANTEKARKMRNKPS